MFAQSTNSAGFTRPARDPALREGFLPALIATLSLGVSIAVLLTAVTMSAARAAQLF